MPDDDKAQLPQGQSRGLTPGEIELAKSVFGSSIDYSKVRINHWKHNPWQEGGRPMAPDGTVYYPPESYKDDFSKLDVYERAGFLHELTHVWQKQNKLFDPSMEAIGLWWSHGRDYSKAYDISNVTAFKDLREYNMEQQGELIKNFYLMRERQKEGPPPPFAPVDYDAKERSGMTQNMLAALGTLYRKDPDNMMIKFAKEGTMGSIVGGPVVFDAKGDAHLVRLSVDEQRRRWEESRRSQEIADKTLTRIMAGFAADPNYINKCPVVREPVEDSTLVTAAPKNNMG